MEKVSKQVILYLLKIKKITKTKKYLLYATTLKGFKNLQYLGVDMFLNTGK